MDKNLICEYPAPWLRAMFSCCFFSADSDYLSLMLTVLGLAGCLVAVFRLIKQPFYLTLASGWGAALHMPAALEALLIFPSSSLVGKQSWFLIYQKGGMGFLPLPSLRPFNSSVVCTDTCLSALCATGLPNSSPSTHLIRGQGGLILEPHVEGSGSEREGFSLGTCDFTNSPCHCRFFFFQASKRWVVGVLWLSFS